MTKQEKKIADLANNDKLIIDTQLKNDINDTVTQWNEVKNLIERATTNKQSIKPALFKKIINEYHERLNDIDHSYKALATQLIEHIIEIAKHERDIQQLFGENNDRLDELNFRHELGEYSKEALQQKQTKIHAEQEELQTRISLINEIYQECKNYLRKEYLELVVSKHALSNPKESDGASKYASPQVDPTTEDTIRSVKANVTTQSSRPQTGLHNNTAPKPKKRDITGPRVTLWDGDQQQIFPLRSKQILIGRNKKSDIFLPEPSVSRKHAVITREATDRFSLVDTSTTGISVNGEQKKVVQLVDGDEVIIDRYRMIFSLK